MGKKDRERLNLRIDDHLGRMTPTDLTRGEVIDSLRAAGCDVEQLRERLHQRARELANAQRAKGKPAPDYLQQVIDCTGSPEAVPNDPKSALAKAKQWIVALTQPPSGIGEIQVARAYCKDGELSQRDKQLLDDMEVDLRRETEGE